MILYIDALFPFNITFHKNSIRINIYKHTECEYKHTLLFIFI